VAEVLESTVVESEAYQHGKQSLCGRCRLRYALPLRCIAIPAFSN